METDALDAVFCRKIRTTTVPTLKGPEAGHSAYMATNSGKPVRTLIMVKTRFTILNGATNRVAFLIEGYF